MCVSSCSKQEGRGTPACNCINATIFLLHFCSEAKGVNREWVTERKREWCCPLRFNKGILFYLCAYTRSTTAVRNTPMPCAHTNADTISRWLCSSFQSARPISAAGLVFGSFISHMGKYLCQCKGALVQRSSSAQARYDQSAWHLSLYNTPAIKNYWSTSTSSPEKKQLKIALSWFGADLAGGPVMSCYLPASNTSKAASNSEKQKSKLYDQIILLNLHHKPEWLYST